MASTPLICPTCSGSYPLEERFCPRCRMPLVYSNALQASTPITEQHERARKIKPQYSEGEPVRVASARNQPEAEFIQGMLLEEGVPSMLRRSAGFDVPDFLAAGPRDILVPQSGAQAARDVLLEAEIVSSALPPTSAVTQPVRLAAFLLLAVAILAVVLVLATHVWS
jgi:uncharacterized protein YbaR (Trm112 family)